MSATIHEEGDLKQLISELERPEVQQSLMSLLTKLPEIEKSIDSIGNAVQFGKAVLQDESTMQKYDDLFSSYNLNLETVASLITLLEKLPKLVKMIEQLENVIDFVSAFLKDEQTTDYLVSNIKEYTEPFLQKGKGGLSILQEVQNKVDCSPENVKMFSIIKWLKDPAVQKGLCYVQATLDVLNDRTAQNK